MLLCTYLGVFSHKTPPCEVNAVLTEEERGRAGGTAASDTAGVRGPECLGPGSQLAESLLSVTTERW